MEEYKFNNSNNNNSNNNNSNNNNRKVEVHNKDFRDLDLISEADLILTDPPYGIMDSNYNGSSFDFDKDLNFDIKDIIKKCKSILRYKGKAVIFSLEPFTSNLIYSSDESFKFSEKLIWKKEHFGNPTLVNINHVKKFEEINVFYKAEDTNNQHPARQYAKHIKNYIGDLSLKNINDRLGHRKCEHFFYITSSQFRIPTEDAYSQLVKEFNLKNMNEFKEYSEIERMEKENIFNLENQEYKSNIYEYQKPLNKNHSCEKPVKLLEDIIRTYTNKGDLVVDLFGGSGQTALAAINTDRNCIITDIKPEYYKMINSRVSNSLNRNS
jgi:site-specific DNA-methyltransferase (adenine-specific)